MGVQFKVVIKSALESNPQFEKRLEDSLNNFFQDVGEKDNWDYTRLLGTGTDTQEGSETYILYKEVKDKGEKKIGFS